MIRAKMVAQCINVLFIAIATLCLSVALPCVNFVHFTMGSYQVNTAGFPWSPTKEGTLWVSEKGVPHAGSLGPVC